MATIPQTALDRLKELLVDGSMILDVLLSDMKEIAGKLFIFKAKKHEKQYEFGFNNSYIFL